MINANAARKFSLFVCLMLFLTMVPVSVPATTIVPSPTETVETGIWVQTGPPVLGEVIKLGDGNYSDISLSISSTSASYHDKEVIGTVGGEEDFIVSEASYTFTEAPKQIKPGEVIPITISGTYTGTSFQPEYYGVADGETFVWIESYYINEDGSTGSFNDIFDETANLDLNEPGSGSETFKMTGPIGGEGYDNKFILQYRIGGGARGQALTYTYEYKSDVNRTIKLLGEVVNIYEQPMPYMNIIVTPSIDDGGKVTALDPAVLQTDVIGGFEYKGQFAPDAKGILSLKLDFLFECGVKVNATDKIAKNVFEMQNLPDNKSASVSASTTIVAKLDDYKGEKDIQLQRHVDFGFPSLKTAALSYGDDGKADPFETNTANAKDLSVFSYIYCQAFNGLYTGVKTFDEKKALIDNSNNLIIELNGPDADWSYFDSNAATPTIRLCMKYSSLSDATHYTILHEFGHYFDWITNNKKFHCLPADATKINVNHGGYYNDVTSDSVLEGFASWYACVAQKSGYFPEKNPEIMGEFGSIATPSLPWVENGIREEFSVSRALWSVGGLMTPADLWKNALSTPSSDLNEYYKLFLTNLEALKSGSEEAVKSLKKIFYENGLYKLAAGNGQYDEGEPFKDIGGIVSKWDAGETYIDIPDPRTPIDYTNMKFGDSADNARVRYSTFLLPNSFLKLTGTIPEYVKVAIKPDTGSAYSYLDKIDGNNRVYIDIPEYASGGTVTVSIPGGDQIYTGDINILKTKIMDTWNQKTSLAEANVPKNAFPGQSATVRPTGGDPDASGYYVVNEIRKINPDSVEIVGTPFYSIPTGDLNSYIANNAAIGSSYSTATSASSSPDRSGNDSTGGTRPTISIWGILISVVLMVFVSFVVAMFIINRKKKNQKR